MLRPSAATLAASSLAERTAAQRASMRPACLVMVGTTRSRETSLRCLHGTDLCAWRLGDRRAAAEVFRRMLWLNPSDNRGRCVRVRRLRGPQDLLVS